jgi:hypothetical protein
MSPSESSITGFSALLDKGVGVLSQRAFAAAQRDQTQRQPSRQQAILKAITENRASTDQVDEAVEFSLATNGSGQVELTPLGKYIFSSYPEDQDDLSAKSDPESTLAT